MGFGSYSPYYYSFSGSYGAYAYPSYYEDSYTYAPVYIESEDTLDTYEEAAADVVSTAQAPADGPEIGTPPDDSQGSIPDGVVVPRPLVEPEEAPEVLPPEDGAEPQAAPVVLPVEGHEEPSSGSEDRNDRADPNELRP